MVRIQKKLLENKFSEAELFRITAKTRDSLDSALPLSANTRIVSISVGSRPSSRPFLSSNEQDTNKKALGMQAFQGLCICVLFADNSYLLLNCGARLAALRPYFLRSFIRGSRVKKPAALSVGRNSPST